MPIYYQQLTPCLARGTPSALGFIDTPCAGSVLFPEDVTDKSLPGAKVRAGTHSPA